MKKPENQNKNLILQQLGQFDQFVSKNDVAEIENDFIDPYVPPIPKDTSKFNPDQIVDIITFCEHPHFCGLRLWPWQRLILKLFYMGSAGNSNIEILDTPAEDKIGCNGCVWQNIKKDEDLFYEAYKQSDNYNCILDVINSPCSGCSRQDKKIIDARFEDALEYASNATEVEEVEFYKNRTPIDNYITEHDLLEDDEIEEIVREQIKTKIGRKFQYLVLVIGRRAGKSFITVICALYELYKLIMMKDPQKRYHIKPLTEIFILNVAQKEEQAKDSIFTPIKNTILTSPFFEPYTSIINELEMIFFTDHDIEENKRRAQKGIQLFRGSLILRCGTSSASGMVGKPCFAIIIDEVAALAGSSVHAPGTGPDYQLYNDLKPSLANFKKDGKMIILSQPKGPVGLLYDLYSNKMNDRSHLILQLPTWKVNQSISLSFLKDEEEKNPVEYNMQYGAKFGQSSQEPLFLAQKVDIAFAKGTQLTRVDKPQSFFDYYCHVDPSETSDYYTLVILHTEPSDKKDTMGFPKQKIIVDYIHFWAPVMRQLPVSNEQIELEIKRLYEIFKFRLITFDQWHSQSMVMNLLAAGLPVEIRTFNGAYKTLIYKNLSDIVNEELIEFYQISAGINYDKDNNEIFINEIHEAKEQFIYLQKKWNGRSFKIEALSGYKDDIPDSIATLAYETIIIKKKNTLPRGRVINTGGRLR